MPTLLTKLMMPNSTLMLTKETMLDVFWGKMLHEHYEDTWQMFETRGKHYDLHSHRCESDDDFVTLSLYQCREVDGNWDTDTSRCVATTVVFDKDIERRLRNEYVVSWVTFMMIVVLIVWAIFFIASIS